jgi:hypothetical protein
VEANIDFCTISSALTSENWNSELKRSSTVAENGSFCERELALIKAFWPPVVTEGIQGFASSTRFE